MKVQVRQVGCDFYVDGDGDEFRVSYPGHYDETDLMARHRMFGWMCRVCDEAGYDPTFVEV